MALTTGNVTIKTSAGTYSTWAAFWDDLGDLTGDITCTVDASAFTEATAPARIGESLNGHTLHVLPDVFPTTTDASTGARFTCNYAGVALVMQMEGAGTVIIEGMVFIEGTSTPNMFIYTSSITDDFNFTVRRNIFKGGDTGFYHADASLTSLSIYNNIYHNAATNGLFISTAPAFTANNTVYNCNNNILSNNVANTFENNLSYISGTLDYSVIGANTVGNNNADSDATGEDADWGTGANNVNSISDPFNALASDDFTITAEGDVGTAGKDLSASFTTDFFGTTRDNWTIGACEYVEAVGVPIFMHHFRQLRN